MASGTFLGTTGNKYISSKIIWSSTADILTNTSSVTATLYYMKSSQSTAPTYGTGTFSIYVNGTSNSRTFRIELDPDNMWIQAVSYTVTVPHGADGQKAVGIWGDGGIPGLSFSTTNCSGSAILDKIPRASTPSWTGTPTIGTAFTISLNPADASFTHSVAYSWGQTTGTISSSAGSSVSWTPPMSLCNGAPNGTQGTVFITVETFTSGGASLGKSTVSGTMNVPASVLPTISAVTLSDSGNEVPAAWGVYVKGKSTLHVNVTAAGAYSSTITGYSITADGATVSGNDADVVTLKSSGSVSVSITVTDSRGRTASTTRSITVQDYSPPVLSEFTLVRANNQGVEVDNGTFAKITLKASGSAVNNKNTVNAKIYHMRSDLSSWTLARTISVAYSIDYSGNNPIMISSMESARSYSYKVEIEDEFNTTVGLGVLNAEGAVMSWMNGGIGLAVGKTAEESYTLDSAWKMHGRQGAQFDAAVSATDYKIGNDSVLRMVDVAQVGMNGTAQRPSASNAYVTVQFSTLVYSLANKLTLGSYGIVIPSGVRYVSISAQLCLGAATAGIRYVSAAVNTTATTAARSQKFHASTTMIETHSISGALIPVTAGDTIILAVYGNMSDTIYGGNNETYLTVTAYS